MSKSGWSVVLGAMLSVIVVSATAQEGPAGSEAWTAKVDPWVMETMHAGATEFLVVLAEQADLSGASELTSKDEKGAWVVEQLQEVAARTQPPVLTELVRLGVPHRAYWIANMIWVHGDAATLKAMADREDVRRVSANPTVKLKTLPADPEMEPEAPAAIEWGITKTGAPSVWALGFKGSGVVVGGQDTGYDWDHPALKSKYRGWNGTTASHDYNWHDAIHSGGGVCGANSSEPCDDDTHGTHTMGTMVGDDGGSNQVGMAPQAKWIGCRNMNQGNGTPTTYAECFQWFIAPTNLAGQNPDPAKAPHVINNSWGCPPSEGCTDPNVLKTVVDNTRAAGIVVVASAGNEGSSCSTIQDPPAIYSSTFTVGATSSSDTIASFSSRGPVVVGGDTRLGPDVSAPGVSVRSSVPGTGYSSMSGTSMAGPHVAGHVALLLSAMPTWKGQVDLVESRTRQTAVGLTSSQTCGGVPGSSIPNNTFGWGRIDTLAAVSMADLGLAIVDTPDPVGVGQQLTYRVFPSNAGPVTATGVTVQLTLPASVTFASASTGCAHAAGVVTCSFGSVVKGTFPEKQVVVTTTAPGTLVAAGSVSGTLYDHNSGNNQAFASTTCGSTADLSLAKTAPYTPALLGAPFAYTLTATNHGPSPVTTVGIVDTLPANASFLTGSPGCTHGAGVVTCAAGALSSGASTAVSITVLPTSLATMSNTAVVSSEQGDPNSANNTSTVDTTVVAAAPVSIEADTHAGAPLRPLSSSNVNGILEPGETVLVVPTWRNPSGGPAVVSGTASDFTGPAGATYTLADDSATYGTIAAGAEADCHAAGGNCFELQLDSPTVRPATHWDVTFTETLNTGATRVWTLHVGDSFADVPRSYWAYRFVETIFHNEVTSGCNADPFEYWPDATLTRAEMAVLLLRAKHGATWTPPGASGTIFTDVPAGHWAGAFIEELAAEGITSGCGPALYCPADPITRAQMAVFLLMAKHGTGYAPPAPSGAVFADVPPGHWAGAFIEQLAAEGITSGCGPGLFCPDGSVTRAEMAVFLTVAFDLKLGS